MNWFNFNIRKIMTIAFLSSLPLISINVQQSPLSTGWFDQPFLFLASVTQNAFFSFSSSIRDTTALYLNLINIKKDNLQLKQQNQELTTRLEAMDELTKENHRLNELLAFKQKSKMDLLAAKIMGKDLISDHNTIQINKGTSHGLKHGQAVITTNGVVGYVFRPEPWTSLVLLITDRYAVIDGIVSRTRTRGVVIGKNSGNCAFRYVEKSEDVKPGDVIVTGGLDNIFPKGFPIATVEAVEHKTYSVSLRVDLKPVVDPDKIEELFIVLNAAEEDLTNKVSMND